MDESLVPIIVASITTVGAIISSIVSSSRTKTKCQEHQKQLAEAAARSLSDPKQHYFFGKMQHYMTAVIPTLHDSAMIPKMKMDMLKAFLLIKFKVFHDGMLKWAHDASEAKLTETATYICALIREYETTARAEGVPPIFIEKFAIRHEPVVTSTIESLEQIMRSTSYSPNDKENAVLDVLLHSFCITILTAEQTAAEMNGTLEDELIRLKLEGKITSW